MSNNRYYVCVCITQEYSNKTFDVGLCDKIIQKQEIWFGLCQCQMSLSKGTIAIGIPFFKPTRNVLSNKSVCNSFLDG